MESCSLSPSTSDPISLDGDELQVAVSIAGTELIRLDIIIYHTILVLEHAIGPGVLQTFSTCAVKQ